MFRQKSFDLDDSGKLYIVATPIGNLEDITMRAISVLKEVDFIAAEDTRQTRKLLTHFRIQTPCISYHEHSQKSREDEIINRLKEGKKIALVSDAGLPAISDPGQELVARCVLEEIPVIPIPGVNAALSALVVSGLSTDRFRFIGFLPKEKKKRFEALNSLLEARETLIFYEAPHRITDMIKDLYAVLGNRKVVIAREITKRYEEFIRGYADEVLSLCEQESLKGEMTVIVEGFHGESKTETPWWEDIEISAHVDIWIEKGLSPKEAIKKVAEERNMKKREIYQLYHFNK